MAWYLCSSTNATYTVSAPINPVVVNGTVIDASGVSANDGEIDVTATGGTPPYFYDWSNGSTAADQTGLAPGVYTVEVTDGAGCAVSSTFTVSYSTGISETEEEGYTISVYPNPANVVLNITISNADIQLITLVDLQGKIVYTDASGDVNTQISLADFAKGVYFVNVQSSKGMTTKKVIVSK
ncbi:MAG: T9SS type A sorting domain-containing protein [Crocinitomicaceae bacterium]|nr:T9SS type A sorting domain-containing protein [Crocinitomicaceae bacterium]